MPEWMRKLLGRKSQEQISNEVAQEILEQDRAAKAYAGRPQGDPLIDEHPGYYIATAAAQPGGLAVRAIAPFAYKGIIQGLQNGESAVEAMAPGFRKMKSFEELGSIRDGLSRSVSGEVRATKNGRVAFDAKRASTEPKRYVPTMSSEQKATYQTPSAEVLGTNSPVSVSERTTAYMQALNQASEAVAMGLDDLAQQFYDYASKLNPQRDAFKSRFLWGKLYKQGGVVSAKSGIHIKKANRGKFTEYCGGKVTSECIARGKASSNPAIRKRATFAANARKWKHQGGGKFIPYWAHNILGGK